ncbi:dehydrogenase/reductase SDR family member 1 [Ciona intestinalis]
MPNLGGKICLVTGASRGIGRGIALQLITNGATCYITGRDIAKLEAVKAEAKHRGAEGKCIPVQCDHSKDEEIKKLFEQISNEQNGTLDLLVNNAYAAVNYIINNSDDTFWDQPENGWDEINNVGLRNHFMCAIHASRLMVQKRRGLIINISSVGGILYFQTPAYGVGKAAKDRMAKDCAMELEKYNVAYISLWPDKDIMNRSGQILLTTDLSSEFNFKDIDGSYPVSMRSFKTMFAGTGKLSLVPYIPGWLKIPFWIYRILLPMTKLPTPRKNESKYQ